MIVMDLDEVARTEPQERRLNALLMAHFPRDCLHAIASAAKASAAISITASSVDVQRHDSAPSDNYFVIGAVAPT